MDFRASREGAKGARETPTTARSIPGGLPGGTELRVGWEGRRVGGDGCGHRCRGCCVVFVFPGVGCLAGPSGVIAVSQDQRP